MVQLERFEIPKNAPLIGAIHSHYKNPHHEYQVTGISLNSDSHEWHVEYIPLYEGAIAEKFNKSLSGWMSPAELNGEEMVRYPFLRMN